MLAPWRVRRPGAGNRVGATPAARRSASERTAAAGRTSGAHVPIREPCSPRLLSAERPTAAAGLVPLPDRSGTMGGALVRQPRALRRALRPTALARRPDRDSLRVAASLLLAFQQRLQKGP